MYLLILYVKMIYIYIYTLISMNKHNLFLFMLLIVGYQQYKINKYVINKQTNK